MVMPNSDAYRRTNTIESIPEDEFEESEEYASENNNDLVRAKDGTFLIPKLNKVEQTQKKSFVSEGIKIQLRHHTFESEPLDTYDEETTRVKLGKPLPELKTRVKRQKVTKKDISQTLAVDLEQVEVYLCHNCIQLCFSQIESYKSYVSRCYCLQSI